MPMPLSLTLTTASSSSRRVADRDVAAVVGVLRGVVQQVGEHLRQPHRIAADARSASGRSRRVSSWRRLSSTGRLVSTAALTMRAQIERLLADLDDAARDARHFEQVVDQPVEVLHLPLHHRARPCSVRGSSNAPDSFRISRLLRIGASGLRSS